MISEKFVELFEKNGEVSLYGINGRRVHGIFPDKVTAEKYARQNGLVIRRLFGYGQPFKLPGSEERFCVLKPSCVLAESVRITYVDGSPMFRECTITREEYDCLWEYIALEEIVRNISPEPNDDM